MSGVETDFYQKAPQGNPLLDTASGFVGLANSALDARQKQQDMVTKQVGYLVNGLSALASKPDLSQQDVVDFANKSLNEGIISPQTHAEEMKTLQAAGNDPGKLRQLLTTYGLRALDAGQRFSAQFGTPTLLDTGPSIQPLAVSPFGVNPLGNPIDKGMTPSESNELVQFPGPKGNQLTTTKGNVPNVFGGQNQLLGPQEAAPAPAAQPAMPPSQGATVVSGPTPQQLKMYAASADQFQQDKQDAANWQTAKLPLEKMIALLPSTNTGKGADLLTIVPDVANMLGIPLGADQSEQLAELKKYANNLARQSGAAPNSDSQLAAAFAANPNTDMNNAAAQNVAKTVLSLARFKQGLTTTAIAQGIAPEDYSDFASQWANQLDPRAFGFDLMDQKAREKLLKGMSDAEYSKFANSLQAAQQLGLVTPPGAAGGQ